MLSFRRKSLHAFQALCKVFPVLWLFCVACRYTIELKHGPFEWTIRRRYKHFRHLQEQLVLFRAKLALPMPSKSWVHVIHWCPMPSKSWVHVIHWCPMPSKSWVHVIHWCPMPSKSWVHVTHSTRNSIKRKSHESPVKRNIATLKPNPHRTQGASTSTSKWNLLLWI